MPRPRKSLICIEDTPYYHCTSRCVRRAFLCGKDRYTGQCYEHRRKWVEDRIKLLASIFSIEICAYAVMSNHTHLVLRVDRETAMRWTTLEVFERWHKIHKPMKLNLQFMDSQQRKSLSEIQCKTVEASAEVFRQRLFDVSWFMKLLNEYIARRANKEDNCTGHFWEGRFKSQAILGETALLATMTYVDLNPIRSRLAFSLEKSDYTSIKMRIKALRDNRQPQHLSPFIGRTAHTYHRGLPFTIRDYAALLEFTGRILRPDKRGYIDASVPSIINTVGLTVYQWTKVTQNIESWFGTQISSDKISSSLCA